MIAPLLLARWAELGMCFGKFWLALAAASVPALLLWIVLNMKGGH